MKYKKVNNKWEVLQAGGLLLTRRSEDATPNRGNKVKDRRRILSGY